MRKFLCSLIVLFLLTPSCLGETLDLSAYTFDELAALRDRILMEILTREEWQEVKVPAGTYQVGTHIPAGHWMITSAPESYCYVTIGSKLEDNGKEIVYGCQGYYHIALAGEDSGLSDTGRPSFVVLELTDGMYIYIEHAYVTFAPYSGQPDPGFVF